MGEEYFGDGTGPVFVMTASDLASVLFAFASHAEAVGKQSPAGEGAASPLRLNDAINEFIANLAALIAEGLSVNAASQSCFYPMTLSRTPGEAVRAWWRGWRSGREGAALMLTDYARPECNRPTAVQNRYGILNSRDKAETES